MQLFTVFIEYFDYWLLNHLGGWGDNTVWLPRGLCLYPCGNGKLHCFRVKLNHNASRLPMPMMRQSVDDQQSIQLVCYGKFIVGGCYCRHRTVKMYHITKFLERAFFCSSGSHHRFIRVDWTSPFSQSDLLILSPHSPASWPSNDKHRQKQPSEWR